MTERVSRLNMYLGHLVISFKSYCPDTKTHVMNFSTKVVSNIYVICSGEACFTGKIASITCWHQTLKVNNKKFTRVLAGCYLILMQMDNNIPVCSLHQYMYAELDMDPFFSNPTQANPTQNLWTQPDTRKFLPDPTESIIYTRQLKTI